jgi:hypothetical protein
MSKPSWGRRIERMILFPASDERTRMVRAIATRNAYFAVSAAALSLGAYYELFAGRSGAFWPIAGIVGLSLLFLLGRRLMLGGLLTTDERLQRLHNEEFRWAYMIVGIGLQANGLYRMAVYKDYVANIWVFSLPISAFFLAFAVTLIRQRIDSSPYPVWLGAAAISFLIALATLSMLGIAISAHGEADLWTTPLGLMGAIFAVYFAVLVWGARRRRREEQEESQDERQIS